MPAVHLVPARDGVSVAVHELGGQGPPLLLAHGTGFCAGVMVPLAAELAPRFRCVAMDLRGHGASPAPAEADFAWQALGEDAAAVVGSLGLAPAFAVGHSSGGAALLLAAAEHPGWFEALWCFEPILWPDLSAVVHRGERLAQRALRRRARFASRQDAASNFEGKPPFSAFDPGVLPAYLDCGFDELPDGSVELRCSPEVEAQMYRMGVAFDGFSGLARVTCPVTVARGAASEAVGPEVVAEQVAVLPAGRSVELPGLSHFGPLEDPTRVASAIFQAFAADR